MAAESYLQGRVKIDQALTIRFTDSDSSATRDVAFSANATFESLDAFATHLQTQINAGGGNFAQWAVSVIDEHETFEVSTKPAGSFKFTTGHAGLQINFNQGGGTTGANLRSYLGHNADTASTANATFYFADSCAASFYPDRGFLSTVRSHTESIVMQSVTLGGHVNTQANIDTNLQPLIGLVLAIQFNTERSFAELSDFETFFDTVFDNVCGGEPFATFQGGDTWIGGLSGGYPVIQFSRMIDGWNGAWRTDLTIETWSDVE